MTDGMPHIDQLHAEVPCICGLSILTPATERVCCHPWETQILSLVLPRSLQARKSSVISRKGSTDVGAFLPCL